MIDQGVVKPAAVFDAVDAGFQSGFYALPAYGMAGHLALEPVGFIDHGRQFFPGEIRQARYPAVFVYRKRPIHIDLDPIRAVGDLLPDRLKALLGPRHHLGPFGKIEFP